MLSLLHSPTLTYIHVMLLSYGELKHRCLAGTPGSVTQPLFPSPVFLASPQSLGSVSSACKWEPISPIFSFVSPLPSGRLLFFCQSSSLRQELMLMVYNKVPAFFLTITHDSSSFQLPLDSHLHSAGTALAKLSISNPLTTFLSLLHLTSMRKLHHFLLDFFLLQSPSPSFS